MKQNNFYMYKFFLSLIGDYDFKIKFKIIVINHDFNFKLKIIIGIMILNFLFK